MATKKQQQKPINKSAFIREHSAAGLKPAQIVALAKKKGLKFSVEYVYSIRQNAKTAKKHAAIKNGNGGNGVSDRAFMKLVTEIGTVHARELIDRVEEAQ